MCVWVGVLTRSQTWQSASLKDPSEATDHVFMIANDDTVIDILKIALDLV